ncbi:MAG: hypothetical protein IID31_13770 [Planctomycetes bacterium]|nr:hypothetical protein [Planctomycetota bacterium]
MSTPEGLLKVVVRRSNPRYALANYWLSRSRAALLVLGLCGVWVGAGLIVGVVRWRVRRRTARRLQRGWCVRCGYDLRGLRRAPGASTE